MRKIAAIAALLAVLLLAATLWGFSGARMALSAQSVRALQGADFEARFARLKRQHENSAVRGTVYDKTPLGPMEDYVILEYTIIVQNRGFLKAEMLEAVVVPLKGDVLCFSQQEHDQQDVNLSLEARPGRQTVLRCYLLTRRDLHAVREIQVSYYVWGYPVILKVRYG